jgi:hypothetical protein
VPKFTTKFMEGMEFAQRHTRMELPKFDTQNLTETEVFTEVSKV